MAYAMWGLVAVVGSLLYIDDYSWLHSITGIIAIILCYTVMYLLGDRESGDAQLKREFGIMRDPDGIVEYVRIADYRAMKQAEIEAQKRKEES